MACLLQRNALPGSLRARSCMRGSSTALLQRSIGQKHLPGPRSVAMRAQEDPDNNLESLFSQELKRRGLDSLDDVGGRPGSADQGAQSTSTSASKSPFQSATTTTPRTKPADTEQLEGQRQRSIAMVNEGLEGLIPRATELLKLGGSVFLAFAPFILAISVLFGGIYLTFGDNFVHGGDRASGPPAYVDPSTLLSEPTVDPYIPYQ